MQKRITISGTIKRPCDYCRETLDCFTGMFKKKGKPFKLCRDCLKEVYGFDLKKEKKKVF